MKKIHVHIVLESGSRSSIQLPNDWLTLQTPASHAVQDASFWERLELDERSAKKNPNACISYLYYLRLYDLAAQSSCIPSDFYVPTDLQVVTRLSPVRQDSRRRDSAHGFVRQKAPGPCAILTTLQPCLPPPRCLHQARIAFYKKAS